MSAPITNELMYEVLKKIQDDVAIIKTEVSGRKIHATSPA